VKFGSSSDGTQGRDTLCVITWNSEQDAFLSSCFCDAVQGIITHNHVANKCKVLYEKGKAIFNMTIYIYIYMCVCVCVCVGVHIPLCTGKNALTNT